jgi:putative ABC transport system permease protein
LRYIFADLADAFAASGIGLHLYTRYHCHFVSACLWPGFVCRPAQGKRHRGAEVLGATMGNILEMIYRDYAMLIIAGFLLAIPLSYYLLNEWHKNFTYHTTIDVGTYAICFLILLIAVSLTIGSSVANPVRSLRSE